MLITIINPTISSIWDETTLETYASAARPGTRLQVVSLKWGPASIEARVDDALATPGILERVKEAESDGASAVIIDCMNDPALYAARETVRIPVIGPAEASMHLAGMLAHRFSIITTGRDDIPAVEELVERYQLSARLASVRALEIPVLALDSDPQATLHAGWEVAAAAIRQDGAGAIILGCTHLANLASQIKGELAKLGLTVPLLNPSLVALRLAETLVSLGQVHSLLSYSPVGEKKQRFPDLI
jgi:allantoin racemase